MKKNCFLTILLLTVASGVWAEDPKVDPTSTPSFSQDLQVEKLKLELERLKLESERVQLQIQSLQMGNHETPTVYPPTDAGADNVDVKKPEKEDPKAVAAQMLLKTEELAKQKAGDDKTVVLDFTNGEIWYKGVRYPLNQFNHLCEDEKWNVKSEAMKLSVNGDTQYRYRYRNLYLEKYQNYPKGVFVYLAPQEANDFSFVSPEGIDSSSSRGAIRNGFETPFLKFNSERREDQWQVLRYKHSNGLFDFDDVMEFWINKSGKIDKVKWGLLDKK